MLTVFEVFPDDTVRARVLADWMALDLRYRDGRCTVSEMVEVLPEGDGERGEYRLVRRVYRDMEVPWYLCHGVIVGAAYPMIVQAVSCMGVRWAAGWRPTR